MQSLAAWAKAPVTDNLNQTARVNADNEKARDQQKSSRARTFLREQNPEGDQLLIEGQHCSLRLRYVTSSPRRPYGQFMPAVWSQRTKLWHSYYCFRADSRNLRLKVALSSCDAYLLTLCYQYQLRMKVMAMLRRVIWFVSSMNLIS